MENSHREFRYYQQSQKIPAAFGDSVNYNCGGLPMFTNLHAPLMLSQHAHMQSLSMRINKQFSLICGFRRFKS